MLNHEKLKTYRIPDVSMSLTSKDTMLYALSVGLGDDPLNPNQLRFVQNIGLRALPTMATVIAYPFAWARKAEIGSSGKVVHMGVDVTLHAPIPPEGEFLSENWIGEVLDKGMGRGALLTTNRRVTDARTGMLVFESSTTSMHLGDGGFGGPSQSAMAAPIQPTHRPDVVRDIRTLPQQALLYRIASGDYNAQHSDPEVARRVGFERPVLHGLCTLAMACHTILQAFCDFDPDRMTAIGCRFTKPVYPGETIRVSLWRGGGGEVRFRVSLPERGDETALDRGTATIS